MWGVLFFLIKLGIAGVILRWAWALLITRRGSGLWDFITPHPKPEAKEVRAPEHRDGVVGRSLTVYLDAPAVRAKPAAPGPEPEPEEPEQPACEPDFDPGEIDVVTGRAQYPVDVDEEIDYPYDMEEHSSSAPFLDLAVAYKVVTDDGTGEVTEQEKITAVETMRAFRDTQVMDFLSKSVKHKERVIGLLKEFSQPADGDGDEAPHSPGGDGQGELDLNEFFDYRG